MAIYTFLQTWAAIIVGGVAGCLGLWIFLNQMAGVPFRALGGNPGKQLWSVIFMIPVPAIFIACGRLGVPYALAWVVAGAWLAVAPSAATKFFFGPKTAKWGKTIAFNAIYAIIALLAYWLVLRFY